MVRIDGTYGEGGGQILRTSLALSCVLSKPAAITGIRAGRKKPGLQPQHLTSVRAAAAVGQAEVRGAELASTAIEFIPTAARGGVFHFDVAEQTGSAGSASLVLQTVLLPLCFAEQPSTVTVSGGTHVPWSPSFHYLSAIVAPLLTRLGAEIRFSLGPWGWYPRGGGQASARITPVRMLRPLTLIDRGGLLRVSGLSAVANLPGHIAERQRDRTLAVLHAHGIDASIDLLDAPSPGKGSYLLLCSEYENVFSGFGSLGEIGKRAETVADEACRELLAHHHTTAALDPHLADQIVQWLAFSRGTSEFSTSRITQHLLTNLWVLQQFMDVAVRVEGKEGEEGRVVIRPRST